MFTVSTCVYKNNKSSILKWSNNDAGGTGGTSEAMSNKLLKLLGGNKTGSKAGSKTANLGGNKSNKTGGLMNVNLGKSLGVGGSSLGSGNALSELSHTASDASSSNRAKIRLPKVVRKNLENIKASTSSPKTAGGKSSGSPKTISSPKTGGDNSPAFGIRRVDSSASQGGRLSLAASPTLERSRTSSVTTIREDNLSSSQSTIRNGSTRKISWSRKL